MLNTENLLPLVIDKEKEDNKFDPNRVFNKLMEETGISDDNAKRVTIDVIRFFVDMGKSIKKITSPMIREVVNVMLVKNGFEIIRLENTRVGIPFYDFNKLMHSKDYTNKKLLDAVFKEYLSVIVLKKKLENGK